MTIQELNSLSEKSFFIEMEKCCGSSSWIKGMFSDRPFKNIEDLIKKADINWEQTTESDWLEAFDHHPKIGDLKSLEEKFANTKTLAGGEQASVENASQKTLLDLAAGNEAYENKFGFIFIVCATGKSAEEMLQLLNSRIGNNRETELRNAAAEQQKITTLRLKKIIT
ncbi:MAG TPA: 2-oxo-4-hydroxy-4-carboxy-5-ureidoimidazoline decarboxylase [Bacteroidia bacterium]|nr:2-oxo-4-hydroxy-4-carboxy-5-ureidoimidazoline decarboxylase [Bacteroidia bacterium]